MKFDGNCLLPSNLQNVKKAQFFIAGAEKEIRLVFANFKKLTVDLNPSEKLKKNPFQVSSLMISNWITFRETVTGFTLQILE